MLLAAILVIRYVCNVENLGVDRNNGDQQPVSRDDFVKSE